MGKFFSAFKKFSDNVGLIATAGGLILIPFFGAAAAGVIATGMASNGAVMTSFWAPLLTDPYTGAMGITEGISRIFNGWAGLAKSGFNVAAGGMEGLSSGAGFMNGLSAAWAAPALA